VVTGPNYNNPPTFFFSSQTQFIKPSAQLRKYDAEHVLEFLNSHTQEITLGDLVEIRNQGAFKEVEKSNPYLKERTMTVSKLAEVLGLTKGQGVTQH
jgi:hypothetical protein